METADTSTQPPVPTTGTEAAGEPASGDRAGSSAPGFVHLHNHSEFSLLYSPLKVADLAAWAAAQGMPAVALTDRGNLFGAIDFDEACRKHGIKAIHGMEVFVAGDRTQSDPNRRGQVFSLVVLAENHAGWLNLMKLSSRGYLEGLHDGIPHVDDALLAEHAEGLVALSGGARGAVDAALREGDVPAARARVEAYREIFGPDHFFLEIQDHGQESEKRVRALAVDLARETGVRLVATNHAHTLRREQINALEVLWAVRLGRTIDDPSRERLGNAEYYLKSAEEMVELFGDLPEALAASVEIAERCDVNLARDDYLLPLFPLPEGFETADDYLDHLSREGCLERYGRIDEKVEKRLQHELGIIRSMGFAGYFLITGDFVRAARDEGIPVGPGRGSAAGSIVCYALGITDIDPLHHDLLFERFLNPERVSMPDIDIDFCFENRERVIDYVVRTYGKNSVCQIITFGKILARGAIRDVGRAMGLGFGETDRIAKMVPEELGITLAEALEKSAELRQVREEDPRYDQLIHTCLELEGARRHTSIHAAGILIAPGDLIDHVPLHKTSKNEVTTQWDMIKVEQMGLLKMDFLGLRTLTVIDKALKFLPEIGGPETEAQGIPLEDPAVYEMLGRGETVGVFQLESSGMQEILRKLKPSRFDDITAVNALYRPGPLGAGMVDDFIDRKHGKKQIEYEHPLLEAILEPTYGVILYQEQVMRIAGDMAGYSLGEADQLRRAMGKKKVSEMDRHRGIFLEGAKDRGVPEDVAAHVFELMAYFAGYGFNKSHSAAYAVLAVQTAWLKAHFPAAFMASTLSSEMDKSDRVVTLVEECRRLGLAVLPPDVNTCTWDFRPVMRDSEAGVRFGLGAVKNVGRGAVEAIVDARERLDRPFHDLYEFCEEVDASRMNRRVIEALILSGACDSLPGLREQKLEALDLALSRAQQRARDRERGQGSLFGGDAGGMGDEARGVLPEVSAWTLRERLRRERELVGMYLSAHPLDEERWLLRQLRPQSLADVAGLDPDRMLVVCVVITTRKVVTARKSGRLIAFLNVEDLNASSEVMCFGDAYEQHRELLQSDDPLVLAIRTTRREGDESNRLVLEKALTLDEACRSLIRGVELRVGSAVDTATVERVLGAIAAHPGETPLVLRILDGEGVDAVEVGRRSPSRGIRPVPELVHELVDALGSEAVVLEAVHATRLAPESRPRWGQRGSNGAGRGEAEG